MTAYIFSTLANDTEYALWDIDGGAGRPILKKSIKIHGGSNVARQNHSKGIFTPKGFVTTISDDDLAILESNSVFQLHAKNGFVKVEKSSRHVKESTEKFHDAVKKQKLDMFCDEPKGMNMKDLSIQKNEQTLPTKKKKTVDE